MQPRRFAIVGTGARGYNSYLCTLTADFKGQVEVVGLYDINPERARVANRLADTQIPVFESYDEMIAKAKPQALVVTSTDATHAEYVVKGLRAGLDVFSEKPLCTTFEQVKAIRQASAAPGAGCGRVTHNLRFFPNSRRMKQSVMDGDIGTILQVRFTETLDRFHGADYFRRRETHCPCGRQSDSVDGGSLHLVDGHHFGLTFERHS